MKKFVFFIHFLLKNKIFLFLFFFIFQSKERAKGKTVEVGRAHFDTEHKRYTVLDAPGFYFNILSF